MIWKLLEFTSHPALDLVAILVPKVSVLFRRHDPCNARKANSLTDFCFGSQHVSFLDVLQDSALYQPPGNKQHGLMIDNDKTAGQRQNVDVEGSTFLFGHQSQDSISHSQDMIFEENVAFEVEGLQAEANAMLNPGWTLRLDGFAALQSTQPSFGMGHFHTEMLEPMLQDEYIELGHQSSGVQHAGYAYLPGTNHQYIHMGGSMLTPLRNITLPSQAQSNAIQRSDIANDSYMSDLTESIDPLPMSKRASKRTRIKASLSRKKPCLTPSHLTQNTDSSALKNNLPSKLTTHTEAAKTINTNNMISSEQLAYGYATADSRLDSMPAHEQGSDGRKNFDNAGIVKDIKILDSERRPMSWPYRNPWRKSLDISVAVLTKGFEKLMTERGEAASSVV